MDHPASILIFCSVVYLAMIVWIIVVISKSPSGYEDENGFHRGDEPPPKKNDNDLKK